MNAEAAARYEAAGAERHGKMPYYTVPDSVLAKDATLRIWAREALDAAANAKKKTEKPAAKKR